MLFGRLLPYCRRFPLYCGRSMSETDSVWAIFHNGVLLCVTKEAMTNKQNKIDALKKNRARHQRIKFFPRLYEMLSGNTIAEMFVPAVSLQSRRLTDTPNKTYSFWSELVVRFWNPLRLCCLNHCSSPIRPFFIRNTRLKVQHSPFVPARITLLTYSTLRELVCLTSLLSEQNDNSKNWLVPLTTPHFNFLHNFLPTRLHPVHEKSPDTEKTDRLPSSVNLPYHVARNFYEKHFAQQKHAKL